MIEITPTRNVDVIRAVYMLPEIWWSVTPDNACKPEEFMPRMSPNRIYLVAHEDDCLIGLSELIGVNPYTYEIHIMTRKEFRKTHAFEAAQLGLKWIFENTQAEKINADVPEHCRHIRLFVRKLGFKPEGIKTKSYLKNGHLEDVHYFGLERSDYGQR